MEEDEKDADTHTRRSKPHNRLSWLLLRHLLLTWTENLSHPITISKAILRFIPLTSRLFMLCSWAKALNLGLVRTPVPAALLQISALSINHNVKIQPLRRACDRQCRGKQVPQLPVQRQILLSLVITTAGLAMLHETQSQPHTRQCLRAKSSLGADSERARLHSTWTEIPGCSVKLTLLGAFSLVS